MKTREVSVQKWWAWFRLTILAVVAASALTMPTLLGGETSPSCPTCLPADTTGPETTMVLDDGSSDSGIFEVVNLILSFIF